MDREAWRAVVHGVAKSQTRLSDQTPPSPPPPTELSLRGAGHPTVTMWFHMALRPELAPQSTAHLSLNGHHPSRAPRPLLRSVPPSPLYSLESPVRVLHDDCAGVPQDEARNPALGCGALVSGGSEHQKHVLLIAGQNLNDLSLIDVYLILLHCRVVVCHQHGGDVATAAAFTLQGERRTERQSGTERGSEDAEALVRVLTIK